MVSCRQIKQPVYRKYPEVKAKDHVLVDYLDTEPIGEFSSKALITEERSPSTGWLGERQYRQHCIVADCMLCDCLWPRTHSKSMSVRGVVGFNLRGKAR